MIVTHVGGPTVLLELGGWRVLTDPTFDPPGGHYDFGRGTSSDKVAGPALSPDEVLPVDVVLLTHDQHADNLDAAGRALLATVPETVTTRSAVPRLDVPARGLSAGSTHVFHSAGRETLEVTATPARHGPPLSRPLVGEVVGFLVRCGGVTVWITGDTVLFGGLRRALDGVRVDVMIVHVGGVRFGLTGPVRYTLTGERMVELVRWVRPRVAVPVHYEGWSHFADGPAGLDRAVAAAPTDVRRRVRRVLMGVPTEV